MKTRNLLITLGAAAFAAITINATASAPAFAPRRRQPDQAGLWHRQRREPVGANTATVSPRAVSNQIKTVAGTSNDVNPAIACAKNMNGTPKAVSECLSHTTMPGCQTVAVASAK